MDFWLHSGGCPNPCVVQGSTVSFPFFHVRFSSAFFLRLCYGFLPGISFCEHATGSFIIITHLGMVSYDGPMLREGQALGSVPGKALEHSTSVVLLNVLTTGLASPCAGAWLPSVSGIPVLCGLLLTPVHLKLFISPMVCILLWVHFASDFLGLQAGSSVTKWYLSIRWYCANSSEGS